MKHTRETRWQASELKFLVTPDCAAALKAWARHHLDPDPYASPDMGDAYVITSLYFDTPEFDVFHGHGSYGRAKYRVRRYGRADDVFLERKLRNSSIVAKRRTLVGIGELTHLESGTLDREWDGYWFHRRLIARGVAPTCQVSYLRTARVAASDGELVRLTIDENLKALPVSGPSFNNLLPGEEVLNDRMIVEMKFRNAMPDLFCRAVEEFNLTPETVSKYKLAARHLNLVAADACRDQMLAVA